MKLLKFYLFGFLVLFVVGSKAQTMEQFNGLFNIRLVKDAGIDKQYEITGLFTDQLSKYSASGAQVGDRIIDVSGVMLEILSLKTNGSEINVIARNFGTAVPGLGDGLLYRPSSKGFPLVSNGAMSNVIISAQNTATLAIDKTIPNYASGSILPVSAGKIGDVVLNTGSSKIYRLGIEGWNEVFDIPFKFGFPATANKGDVIYYANDDKNYVYDGGAWVLPKEVSALPVPSKYGDVYYDTGQQKLFMYDVNNKWLNISGASIPGGPGTELPSNTKPGDLFFNTQIIILYMYLILL
ncbi:hypothetical protein [Pedobacter sp. NJ-S-72]